MKLQKPEIDRETAMQLWIEEHSNYAKEQVGRIENHEGVDREV